MPDFVTIKSTLSVGKKLSKPELARAIRFGIAAEYEAVQIYQQLMESVDDKKVIAVIKDIIEEERVHAGQFMDLLFRVDPEESKRYDEGAEENKKL